jgi:REP-associated tyrosine transposase
LSRLPRSTIAGYPHQLTQRGNYGQRVFDDDEDYERYLSWAQDYTERYSIEVWAYCLMPNHVHFVCVPKVEGALALCFNTLHMRYAQYFHHKKGVTGHLWKGRFLSCMLDDLCTCEEIRFIENNPVRSGIVRNAEEYPWSSARSHVSQELGPLLRPSSVEASIRESWKDYLHNDGDADVIRRIRACLRTGRPAGTFEFVQEAERILGRRLRALPRGRPRKSSSFAPAI